ncbi:MAG: hypothetical protein ACK5LJ_11345 [Paracoccus sp. (in: a-proteobacteria)]
MFFGKLVQYVKSVCVVLAALVGLLLVAACSPPPQASGETAADAKLGTQWGEGVESRVTTVSLKRRGQSPDAVHVLHYDAARGSDERLREVMMADGRVGLRVLKSNGSPWPIYRAGRGERVQGASGERYILEYRNYSRAQTYEVVATVDGLDVLNGQPGSVSNAGYILRPGEKLRIEGFRKSQSEVAAFRFSSPGDSYAANSEAGSIHNVGVIGSAVFELAVPGQARTAACNGTAPCAFAGDADSGYAKPPSYR